MCSLSMAAAYAAAIEVKVSTPAQELGFPMDHEFRFPIGRTPKSQSKTPFPDWLTAATGLTEWPGSDPPYIPMDFINFDKIEKWRPYKEGRCTVNPRDSCSFDCDKCVAHDDVYTCRKLSQTFDDGPSQHTLTLLDHLKHKTTFFTLGMNIVDHPEIYRKIVDGGHLIGTHTWSHPFLPSLSNEEIIAQLQWSIWAMNATGNHLPKWFRPPYGGIDNRVRSIARQFGLQSVLWDHDTLDWMSVSNPFLRSESDILKDVREWAKSPSGIILEHDGNRKTVDIATKIDGIIGDDQLTAAECVGGIDYIKVFDT
ncbi:unnamed protein product [Kluyveromyces dobzhanskii CBS 2104]|uniref:chitin deacetylase n=1 Tax=Kluyveromyces dobzhanskii CBS 2104 TaxID=1427455 RepID=A0A0A8L502_9SACH|nr:unnamed protein product [Kluyveromyces dobzhanskii CBS 2104]